MTDLSLLGFYKGVLLAIGQIVLLFFGFFGLQIAYRRTNFMVWALRCHDLKKGNRIRIFLWCWKWYEPTIFTYEIGAYWWRAPGLWLSPGRLGAKTKSQRPPEQ